MSGCIRTTISQTAGTDEENKMNEIDSTPNAGDLKNCHLCVVDGEGNSGALLVAALLLSLVLPLQLPPLLRHFWSRYPPKLLSRLLAAPTFW
jgi:hypothetical protein